MSKEPNRGTRWLIHIVELTPARSWGASAMIPFFGGLTATDRTSLLHDHLPEGVWIYEIDSTAQTVGFQTCTGDFELAPASRTHARHRWGGPGRRRGAFLTDYPNASAETWTPPR